MIVTLRYDDDIVEAGRDIDDIFAVDDFVVPVPRNDQIEVALPKLAAQTAVGQQIGRFLRQRGVHAATSVVMSRVINQS